MKENNVVVLFPEKEKEKKKKTYTKEELKAQIEAIMAQRRKK